MDNLHLTVSVNPIQQPICNGLNARPHFRDASGSQRLCDQSADTGMARRGLIEEYLRKPAIGGVGQNIEVRPVKELDILDEIALSEILTVHHNRAQIIVTSGHPEAQVTEVERVLFA